MTTPSLLHCNRKVDEYTFSLALSYSPEPNDTTYEFCDIEQSIPFFVDGFTFFSQFQVLDRTELIALETEETANHRTAFEGGAQQTASCTQRGKQLPAILLDHIHSSSSCDREKRW